MTSEELYKHLTSFKEETLTNFGMEKEGEFWIHPKSSDRFEVSGENLIVYRGGIEIGRLCASINDPESLYSTLIETNIIEAAVHLLYLLKKGFNI